MPDFKDMMTLLEQELADKLFSIECGLTTIHNFLVDVMIEKGMPLQSEEGVMGHKGGPGCIGTNGVDERKSYEIFEDILENTKDTPHSLKMILGMIDSIKQFEGQDHDH